MTAIPRKEVTTREVASIRFGLLTDNEVKKLSVKQIVSPQTYDAFGTPVPDGLYDAHLGPVDHAGRCGTCGLNHTHCPGHFGHIELPVPVYNPLVFGTLYKLIRHTCLHCHQFKMGRPELAKFCEKLDLIERGELTAAAAISITGQMKGKDTEDYGIPSAPEPETPGGGRAPKTLKRGGAAGPAFTSAAQEALIECVHSLFARMPKSKCANCGALNPVIKKQGSTKLFRVYTSRKAIVQNRLRGVTLDEILAGDGAPGGEQSVEALEQQVVAQVTETSRKRKRAAAAAAADKDATQHEGQEGDDDDDDGDDDDKEDEVLVGKMEGSKGGDDEDIGWDDEEDEEVQGGKRGAKAARRGGVDVEDEPDLEEGLKARYLPPDVVEDAIRKLCKHEAEILRHVYGVELGSGPAAAACVRGAVAAALPGGRKGVTARTEAPRELHRVFFMRALAITPNRFRPPSVMGDQKYEHTQNVLLQRILNDALNIASTKETLQAAGQGAAGAPNGTPSPINTNALTAEQRSAELSRFMGSWLRLQNDVNALLDSTTAENADQTGIRQQLEKKEGLFRKNMMGKRVNFAARSVISPDPYIGAGEIGVPPYFATRLSFPEAVTPWNVERLRGMVARGSHEHPGAVAVEDERGRVVSLEKMSAQRREALSKQLLASGGGHAAARTLKSSAVAAPAVTSAVGGAQLPPAGKGWVVYRHLLDGDIMLTNRQPTLHKPGLMAHKARVLKGERTIRMHYANCATFNADFDGDEINLHLPQDQYGRAEGYGIVHADHQYIVPTDGKPIRGLIQDHVGGGVLFTKRDTFFTRQQAMQLLYVACTAWSAGSSVHQNIALPMPALLKPRQLWTGKQLLSAVVRHYSAGQPPLSFTAPSKVPSDYWGRGNDEGEFVFHKGELMAGCLDKSQFGKFGLVHAVQEVYGDAAAGQLLSALSRLLTNYLQWVGFTCGLDDLLLRPPSETARSSILATAEAAAMAASAEMVGRALPKTLNPAVDPALNPEDGQAERERVLAGVGVGVAKALAARYRANREVAGATHDMKVTGAMHPLSSEVIRACIPAGQVKPFPGNCMSLMTVSGAKGSLVNFSQISCLLGQQELEGRRVPRMASGKTLPCFRPFDGGARSGGFVGDRFLSGLRPQEYYFHCMAGREGLVDTTVKTSRSGYLQRCLVKNLEALRVSYDYSVRDASDGSVVQLYYGEDGLDVTKTSYLRQFPFMATNAAAEAVAMDLDPASLLQHGGSGSGPPAGSPAAAVAAMLERRHDLRQRASKAAAAAAAAAAATAGAAGDGNGSPDAAKQHKAAKKLAAQPTLMESFWPSALGATSDAFADAVGDFVASGAGGLVAQGLVQGSGSGEGKKGRRKSKGGAAVTGGMDAAAFTRLMQLKYQRALAAPGEAVGVLAAQSIGEPSTQMTLNTFHMAGRGEANVTLGIPRLREILMTAATKIKTPTMTIPLRPGSTPTDALSLANRMRKLKLAECLAGISVTESPVARLDSEVGAYGRSYAIKLQFHEPHKYPKEAEITFEQLSKAFRTDFQKNLKAEVKKALKRGADSAEIGKIDLNVLTRAEGEDFEEGDEAAAAARGDAGDDGEGGEPASSSRAVKKASEKGEQYEDFEEDEELREGKLRFRGGREEAATYEGPDAEEAAAAKAAERAAAQRKGDGDSDDEDEQQQRQAQQEGQDGQQEEEEEGEEGGSAAARGRGGASSSKAGKGRKSRKGKEQEEDEEQLPNAIDPESCTCEVQLVLPLSAPKLIMLQLVERVAAATVVRSIKGIEKVHVLEPERGSSSGSSSGDGVPRLQTEGLNLQGAWAHKEWLDVDRIVTNDVHAMLMAYGVEAARATILREAQAVFGAYGIGVDVRHLSLIADFMTQAGGYRACNRIGIESSTSPLLKMSFETAAKFLTEAALRGEVDELHTPAARLAVGGVAEVGTGVCTVLHAL